MKYSELYATLEKHLASSMQQNGFKRLKMAPPTWARPCGSGFTVIHIYGSTKVSYLQSIGGRFYVKLFNSATEKPDWKRPTSLMRFLSDGDLLKMHNIQSHVIERIIDQIPTNAFTALSLETWKPLLELEKEATWRQRQEQPLRFFVSDDVEAWGSFLAQHLFVAISELECSETTQ